MQIHLDAAQGNIAGVAQQIANGVDVDSLDKYTRQTPLMCAVNSPDATLEMLEFLVNQGANINAIESEYNHNVLCLAVQTGNLEKIKFMLQVGANINYQRPEGYDILIDALHGRDITIDQNLISLLNFLIEKEVNLNTITDYGESALRVCSRLGRFDAVDLLLKAGASFEQLQWTDLMYAVVFEDVNRVEKLVEEGAKLEAQDYWSRTSFLLSLQARKLEIAQLLLCLGANQNALGRCGKTPLMYAIENNDTQILEWLIKEGFDIEITDEFKTTPLILAAEYGATDCVRLLLEYGADISKVDHCNQKAINQASNVEIIKILVDAGEDLSEIRDEMRPFLTGVGSSNLQVTEAQYQAGKYRKFGQTNPEIMNIYFWKGMIKSGVTAWAAKDIFADTENLEQPVWCYRRFGRTITQLPDRRIVEIAGEHEDFYDPDFCIYNDVVVYDGQGNFTIFGYPENTFPATDFHSATLVGNFIYIIGNLGYWTERICNETPVYRLNYKTFKIEKIETTGDKPGWISQHKAYYQEPSQIHVKGGKIWAMMNEQKDYIDNYTDYILDLKSLVWSIIDHQTNYSWISSP